MEYIHIFVNFFANGKSEMKIYLFFVFFISMFFINYIFNSKKTDSEKSNNLTKKVILYSIFTLFTLNIASFVYFFKINDISLSSHIYIFNSGESSSSNILHNHTLKSPVGLLLEKSKINPAQEYIDTGYAFTSFFSDSFLYLVLILLLILIIYLFIYCKDTKKSFLQIFIFTIFSFSILKNILDGGFFHTESILAITSLLIILKNDLLFSRKDQQINILFFIIYLFITTIIAFTTSSSLPLHGMNFFVQFIQKFFLFFGLLILYYNKQLNKSIVFICLLPILIIILIKCFLLFMYKYESKITNINIDQQITAYIKKPLPDILNVKDFFDLGENMIVSAYVSENISIYDLNKKINSNYFYDLKTPDVNCEKSIFTTRIFETRLSEKNIVVNNNLFNIELKENILHLNESGCMYINPSILSKIFKQNKIKTIILIQNS